MTRGIQNAESGPDDRRQVMVRSHPAEKVGKRRLPSEFCWSQSCPLTCPTTSEAPGLKCFQTVRGHLQSHGSVNKLKSLEAWEAQSGLVTVKNSFLLQKKVSSGFILWITPTHIFYITGVHLQQPFFHYALTFACNLTVQLQQATQEEIRKNASWIQYNIEMADYVPDNDVDTPV